MRNAADAAQEIIAGGLTGAELTAFLRRFQADALESAAELFAWETEYEGIIVQERIRALKPETPPPPKP